MKKERLLLFAAFLMSVLSVQGRVWTFEECLQYAMQNNISLQKSGLTRQTAEEMWAQSKAALFPSLNFTTGQNVAYQPWKVGGTTIQNNELQAFNKSTSYNGSYNVAASWTVWNGNRNRNQVKANHLSMQQAAQDSVTQARNIEERIATLFVQILYSKEAVKVNEESLAAAKVNEERGMEMVRVGSMSRADLSQLTAQRAQDEYNVVQAQSNVRNYKRQLKALLQITDQEEFDIVPTEAPETYAMQTIPDLAGVYNQALQNRPEIKSALLAVESAQVQEKIAKSQRMPTVNLNAAATSNTSSLSNNAWGTQIKNNFNMGGGVSIQVPIIDQRTAKTAIRKANIQKQTAMLEVRNQQTTLYSTLEDYWIQAYNNQTQFKSAMVSTKSAKESYDLLSEQFKVGLKNIVELQEGKMRLLSAQQSELQAKYTTILCLRMLEFYQSER